MGAPVLLIAHHACTMSKKTHRREAEHATGQGRIPRVSVCNPRFASHRRMERVLTTNRRMPVRARPIVVAGPSQLKRWHQHSKEGVAKSIPEGKTGNKIRSGWWAKRS